jgi:putative copper resistance protein D
MLGAAIWIGGLLSLFYMVGAAQRREIDSAVLMRALGRFSLIGFGAVLFIIASGLLNSWFLVGSLHALLHMAYGQVLMLKVSLFLCMIALALFNRLCVMPRFAWRADTDGTLRLLLRSIAVEQIFAVLVVASVSLLGTLPPAMDLPGMTM